MRSSRSAVRISAASAASRKTPAPRGPVSETIPDWLARAAASVPERPAVIGERVTVSYAELDETASRGAVALRSLGVAPGERVAVLARNGPLAVAAVHAARRARAVLVPLHPRLAADELAWQAADAGARILLHDDPSADLARAIAAGRDGLELADLGALADRRGARAVSRVRLGETQAIIYTSGTTARPKGVVLTHANQWWSAVGSALRIGSHADDRWLLALPLAHIGGLAIVQRASIAATPLVVLDAFDPDAANAAVDERGVTLLSAVADMLRRMLDARGDRPFPPTLRGVLVGGGPASAPLLDECARRGVPVACTYGLTEAASQVATQRIGAIAGLSCGAPLAVTDVRVECDGRAAQAGEEGEILVRGPTVMRGYHGLDEKTAAALGGGWLRTGDLGALDERGEVHVSGRADGVIVSGGENVSLAELERVLLAHPAVAEALVAAVAHPRWGAVPVAAVVPRAGCRLDAAALEAHCRAQLAAFKVPARLSVVASLPRGPSGKPRAADIAGDAGG